MASNCSHKNRLRELRKVAWAGGNVFMDEKDTSLLTRPSLLIRLRDPADAASWRAFVDTYGPLVYRYLRRRSLQDADAADVTQEVLAEVARCIRSFTYQPERGRFRDWLGSVTKRRLIRFFERQRKLGTSDLPPFGDDLESDALSTQGDAEWTDTFNTQILQVALSNIRPHFEPDTWHAFERVWIDNRSASEVALELDRPVHAIYVAKCRVLKRLEAEILILAEDVPHF